MPAVLTSHSFSLDTPYATRQDFVRLPATPLRARPLDGAAFVILPRIAKFLGYTFRIGASAELRRDAAFVTTTVLGEADLIPSTDVAWYGQRYDDACTWVVAYRGALPVAALAILDMRIASIGLDLAGRVVPASLGVNRTREIGRLSILKHHRESRLAPAGLLLTALGWMLDNDVNHLFAAADTRLSLLLHRLSPATCEINALENRSVDPVRDRYFRRARLAAGPIRLLALEVDRAATWRFLWRQLFV